MVNLVEKFGTGTIAALNGEVDIPVSNDDAVGLTLSGTWVAALVFEATENDSTWFTIPGVSPLGSIMTGTTANSSINFIVGGYSQIRVRASAFTSGTVTVAWNSDGGAAPIQLTTSYVQTPSGFGTVLRQTGLDAGNSTSATLGANGTITGVWTDVSDFSNLTIGVVTDQVSATDGLIIEYSYNGSTSADNDTYTIPANSGQQFSFPLPFQYYRVRYINGAVAQTSFMLSAKLHATRPKPSSHRLKDTLSAESDAELVKAAIMGVRPDTTFGNVEVSANGDLATSDVLDSNGTHAALTVGTTAVAANVSGTNLTARKSLTVYNNGVVTLYWGYSNAVTTATGTPIEPGRPVIWGIGPDVTVYLISGTAAQNARVTEAS